MQKESQPGEVKRRTRVYLRDERMEEGSNLGSSMAVEASLTGRQVILARAGVRLLWRACLGEPLTDRLHNTINMTC